MASIAADFAKCSGLDFSQDPIDYREGPDPLNVRKLPGLIKYSNIVLKWGLSDDQELWEWRQEAIDGKVVAQEWLDHPAERCGRRKDALELQRGVAYEVDRSQLQRNGQRGRHRDARNRP